MPGFLILVSALAIPALTIGLLFIPAGLRIRLKANPEGGRACLKIRHPLYAHTAHIRFYFLGQPCWKLKRIRGDGGMEDIALLPLQGKNRDEDQTFLNGVFNKLTIKRIRLGVTGGVDGRADQTALLYGLLHSLTEGALRALKARIAVESSRVAVTPVFDEAILSLEADCMIRAVPAQIIIVILRKPRKKK